ncbi:MAG: hypothetical protein JXB85_01075 [Anaerolineales bacterium]|nr:hypothetical protein [Anaerolineales bacterium]
MSTTYSFIPCLREGLTAAIEGEATARRVEIDVKLGGEARNKSTAQYEPFEVVQKVQLYGPGDILGFDSRVVARTEPQNHAGNFEPNYFPFIEFSEPDFLWRFTPKKADPDHGGSLDPWITLIVLVAEPDGREFTEKSAADPAKNPDVEEPPVDPAKTPYITVFNTNNLPDLDYAWQWAHVQVTHEEAEDAASQTESPGDQLEWATGRLMCARRLRPKTLYHAFVVPTFQLGLVAAGIPIDSDEPINAVEKSWDRNGGAVDLPYYYRWEFRTGLRGDFEYLVRLLEPRDLPGLGTRPMDCGTPGYGIAGVERSDAEQVEEMHVLKLEGALQSPGTEYTPWGKDAGKVETFQAAIAEKLLNKPARDLGTLPGNSGSQSFTYTVTETGTIFDVSLKLQSGARQVRFEWRTAKQAGSRIDYGRTSEYGLEAERPVLRAAHVLTLVDLVPHETYYFKITGSDPSDSAEGTFTMPEFPSVVPPIYGQWHRAQTYVNPEESAEWLNALNLDPRHRAAAGLGTEFIKKQQEALMASAWEQVGDVLKANKILSQAQVGRDTGKHVHLRMRDLPLERFLFFSASVQKRVTMENPWAAGDSSQPQRISIDQFIKKNTEIPAGIMDQAFRRIGRARGPVRKRQNRVPRQDDLLTRLASGTLEPAGPLPRLGGTYTPCRISHILSERMPELVCPEQDIPPDPMAYTLTVNAGKGGTVQVSLPGIDIETIGEGSGKNYSVQAKASIKLAAVPSQEDRFDHWSGVPIDGEKDPGASFEMNGSYTVAACFEGQEHEEVPLTDTSTPSMPIPDNIQETATLFCEDAIQKYIPNLAQFIEQNSHLEGVDGIDEKDIESMAAAVEDALSNWLNEEDPPGPHKVISKETLEMMRETLDAALDPEKTVAERVKNRFRLSPFIMARFEYGARGDPLGPIMAAPQFPQPMYKQLSQDHLLPGVETVPQNTLSLLQTNRRFIESYMVGLNHEFARELLWRRYPTDQRGSYFRQFWDVRGYVPQPEDLDESGKLTEDVRERLRDIKKVHEWNRSELGENVTCPENASSSAPGHESDNIVLLVRGDLLKRYPNTVIYAVDAIEVEDEEGKLELRPAMEEFLDGFHLKDSGEIPQPKEPYSSVFKGTLPPDLTFLGFPFGEDHARGNDGGHGVYFILEERVGETRFGLDLPNDKEMQGWDDLCWGKVGLGTEDDIGKYISGDIEVKPESPGFVGDGKTWTSCSSSAERAWITMQKPVRVAIHSDQMLPKKIA